MSAFNLHIFYTKHKSLAINIFALLLFLVVNQSLGKRGVNNLDEAPWVGVLFVLAYLLEPWATKYSMGAFHARKTRAEIKTIKIQKWMNHNYFLMIVFWGVRLALFSVMLAGSLQSLNIPNIFQNQFFTFVILIGLMVREGFVIYYMVREEAIPNFSESYDFLADIVLAVMLVFGQFIVGEIFRDLGVKGIDKLSDMIEHPFTVVFFIFLFYFPVRYTNTIEDLTFAITWQEKVERVLAMLILLIGFLLVF